MFGTVAKYGDTFDTIDSGADYDLETIAELVDIIEKSKKKAKTIF